MDNTKTIKLEYSIPVKLENGETAQLNTLTLQRLKAKHLKLLPKGFSESDAQIEPQQMLPLIAGLADIPLEAVEEIDMSDIPAIAEDLESFLSESLEIGKK